jgi:hypothetical protein
LLSGCGNALWAMRANGASHKVEEAREVGAEDLAPYEFWMAVEHLKKAREEAADADYGDAIDLADNCMDYAEKAIRLAREAHRGAGR